MAMRVVSVNVGVPRTVAWRGEIVTTGIFKEPVVGAIPVRTLNFDGDRQADLTVHGGPQKAVYAYPAEHYAYWREQLPDVSFAPANFGENLTTEGLLEDAVEIGDRFRVGTAELVVEQPRFPCYKLGVRFGDPAMVRRFQQAERSGIYFSVAQEGLVQAGDAIAPFARSGSGVTIADIVRVFARDRDDVAMLRRIVALSGFPEMLGDYFADRLAILEAAR